MRNHCLEYLLAKSLSLSEDLFSGRDRYLSSNLRVASEKLKQSEGDAARYRQELQAEKENAFRRMQDVERDRVTLKTENAVLTEKYHTIRQELDDLKLRQATHFNEKLHEIESQNKANKEELKRKEGQIIEMNNEIVKVNNENGKKMALVE